MNWRSFRRSAGVDVKKIGVQKNTINVSEAIGDLTHPEVGGLALFLGTVRNEFEGRASLGLYYDAYADLAEEEMSRIADEMLAEFDIRGLVFIHRIGELALGETAVLVAVSASHRDQALQACQVGIDRIKARVPIWKKERWADGESSWHDDSKTDERSL